MERIAYQDGGRYTPAGHDAAVTSRSVYREAVDVHVTTFPPGSGMQEEIHQAQAHVFYVLRGRMEVLQHGALLWTLGPDDAVVIHAGEAHEIRNSGEADAVFLAITFNEVKSE